MNAKEMAAREGRIQSVGSDRMGAIQRRMAGKKPAPGRKLPSQAEEIVDSRKKIEN